MSLSAMRAVYLADASREAGIGHLMRGLTMAVSLQLVGIDLVITAPVCPKPIVERAERLGVSLQLQRSPLRSVSMIKDLHRMQPAFVVLDGYGIPRSVSEEIGSRYWTVAIDDNRNSDLHGVHVILNQNAHAASSLYEDLTECSTLLLGQRWVLLRPEVLGAKELSERPRQGVFVLMGGSDPLGLGSRVRAALVDAGFAVEVAPGLFERNSAGGVSADVSIVNGMSSAVVAVVAAGSSTWECAFLGTPMVAVSTAPNQRPIAASVAELGLGLQIDGEIEDPVETIAAAVQQLSCDHARLQSMSEAGRALVDGQGPLRIAGFFEEELLRSH